jgi:ATP-dependent Clp protease adaptor protein ClpS
VWILRALRVARGHAAHLLPLIVTTTFSSTQPQQDTHTELDLAGICRVVVLNDPVNLMSYVVLVFKKVFGFDEQTARKHMLEVHELGRSIVWSGLREKAEAYAFTLHEWHLTAIIEPDEKN